MAKGQRGMTLTHDARSTIGELLDEFAARINVGDAEALASGFYAEEALLLPPNHPAVRGRNRICEFWRGLLDARLGDFSLEITETKASGGLAFATGTYSFAIGRTAGAPLRDSGKWLAVYRRQADGSWRAVNHMFSSDQVAA